MASITKPKEGESREEFIRRYTRATRESIPDAAQRKAKAVTTYDRYRKEQEQARRKRQSN